MSSTDAFEKTVEKFNLDPQKEYEPGKSQIPIPIEWRKDFLLFHINTIKNVVFINLDERERLITITCELNNIEKFEEDFHSTLLLNMSKFIKNIKNEDPKKYYRGLVLETKREGMSFKIQF